MESISCPLSRHKAHDQAHNTPPWLCSLGCSLLPVYFHEVVHAFQCWLNLTLKSGCSIFSAAHIEAASWNCKAFVHVMWTPPNNLMALYLSNQLKLNRFSDTTSASTLKEFPIFVVILVRVFDIQCYTHSEFVCRCRLLAFHWSTRLNPFNMASNSVKLMCACQSTRLLQQDFVLF